MTWSRSNCCTHAAVAAKIVTSAVVAALLDAGIRTIGLNVERTNTPAIRAYEAIGLRSHLNYYEGAADRLPQS